MRKLFARAHKLISWRNKSGFTLLEMIVTCAILGILSISVTLIMSSTTKISATQKDIAVRMQVVSNTLDTLKSQIRTCTYMHLSNDLPYGAVGKIGLGSAITVEDGRIYLVKQSADPVTTANRVSIFDEDFYCGYDIALSFKAYPTPDYIGGAGLYGTLRITVKLILRSDPTVSYSSSDTFKLGSMVSKKQSILFDNDENTVMYFNFYQA